MSAEDCQRPRCYFRTFSIVEDYAPRSASFCAALAEWLKKRRNLGIKVEIADFKSTDPSAQPEFGAWYNNNPGYTGELILPPTTKMWKIWVDVALHMHLNMVSGKLTPTSYVIIAQLEDKGIPGLHLYLDLKPSARASSLVGFGKSSSLF